MSAVVGGLPPVEGGTRQEANLPWKTIAWFAGLLIFSYLPILVSLVKNWNSDEDMGHGFFVPVVALYIAWQRKEDLLEIVPRSSVLGLVLMVWGAVQQFIAALGAELFLQRTAFIISVVGVLLYFLGAKALKVLTLPLVLLLFMVPLPAIVYNQITFPLQLFASRMAEAVLGLIGIPVLREGNVLELASQKLSVVEACSGIRSLLSLTFLSLVYAYFFDKRAWMRPALLAATIPIAILANSARVTITGILSEFKQELAQGFFHAAEGWVIFMVALVALVITHKLIDIGSRMVTKSNG